MASGKGRQKGKWKRPLRKRGGYSVISTRFQVLAEAEVACQEKPVFKEENPRHKGRGRKLENRGPGT